MTLSEMESLAESAGKSAVHAFLNPIDTAAGIAAGGISAAKSAANSRLSQAGTTFGNAASAAAKAHAADIGREFEGGTMAGAVLLLIITGLGAFALSRR